jgi:hypothetical protein
MSIIGNGRMDSEKTAKIRKVKAGNILPSIIDDN